MRVLRWLLSAAGYLLFTLLVLGLVLWYKFPGDAVRKRVEAELSALTPGFTWEIDKVGLVLPAAVKFSHVTLHSGKISEASIIRFDSLTVHPYIVQFVQQKKLSATYTMELFNGIVKGHCRLGRAKKTLTYDGIAKGVKLGELISLHKELERSITGGLSAEFSGSVSVDNAEINTFQGNIVVTNGLFGLQQPVLGMKNIDFHTINLTLSFNDKILSITEGHLAAKMLSADFTGMLTPYKPEIMRSSVQLQGELTPRPELMASFSNGTQLTLFKKQLKDGKLSFAVNGSLKEPGLFFTGLPADFNSLLQGS